MIDYAASLLFLLQRDPNLIQVLVVHEIILFDLLSTTHVIVANSCEQLNFLLCRHTPIVFGVCRGGLRSIVVIVEIGRIE